MRYTRENLTVAARNSTSIAGVLRFLGVKWSGGTHHHVSRRLQELGVDTNHFTGSVHNRGKAAANRKSPKEILIARPGEKERTKGKLLRRALLEIGVAEQCAECEIGSEWRGKRLVLHIDHVNGDFLDDRLDNLRFLCPNCHSQTPTFAGKLRNRRLVDEVHCSGTAPPIESPPRRGGSEKCTWPTGPWTQDALAW